MLTIVYNIILSLWIGGITLFTFIITPAVFRSFDRGMAGQIVGKLFPGYFLFLLVLSLAALAVYLIPWKSAKHWFTASVILLVLALAVNIFVYFRLHPEIEKVKKAVTSFETMPINAPPRAKFRKLHAKSAVLNLFLLADGASLLIISLIGKRNCSSSK